MAYTAEQVARLIDHTLLKPERPTNRFVRWSMRRSGLEPTPSACPRISCRFPRISILMRSSWPSCAVSLPGAHRSEIKAAEAALSVAQGADEVDMVINVADAVQNKFDAVEADIPGRTRCHMPYGVLKVIIESAH